MTQFCEASSSLFKRHHCDAEIILVCVRWYLTYKLSYRDLAAMMAERGIDVAHTTSMRRVQRSVPGFEKQWRRYTRPVGTSWRVDETDSKMRGKWAYLYRGVERAGLTVDFLFSEQRDMAAATRFLQQAIEKQGLPQKLTLDGYAASHEALTE